MSIFISVPAIALFVGAIVYLFASNPKLAELGRLLFAAAIFALCFILVKS